MQPIGPSIKLHKLRPAFTILEILVSVVIISVSIIYVLKLHTSNREQIIYISERNKRALSDSLFLTRKILKYHKETKSAYDLLSDDIKVDKDESRQILKKEMRSIYTPDELIILPPPNSHMSYEARVNEVKLKGHHPSTYWHLKIVRF